MVLLGGGCASTNELPNGCVVEAIHHQQTIEENRLVGKSHYNGVLTVSFLNRSVGHAVSVFEYNGKLYAFDPDRGSRLISSMRGPEWQDPSHLARLTFPQEHVLYATWL